MIQKQEIYLDDDRWHIRNTFDIGEAKSMVAESNKNGGERGKDMVCLGHVPPEMFAHSPILIEANKAQAAGDHEKYTELILMFFEQHPELKVVNQKKYYSLGGIK